MTRPWRALEAVPVLLFAVVLTLIGGVIAGAFLTERTALVVFGLVFELALVSATMFWVLVVRKGSLDGLGLRPAGIARHAAFGAAAGLAVFAVAALVVAPVLVQLVSLLAGEDVTLPRQEVIPSAPSPLQIALGAIAVVVAAPFGEELFFRGFLFGALRERLGFGPSAIISAIVFGLFHVIPLLIPVMVFVGFWFAWIYERRGSLFAPVAAHAAFNIVGYTFIVRSLL